MKVDTNEAKSQLSRLAELAHQGEEVVICKAGTPWLRLIPHREHAENDNWVDWRGRSGCLRNSTRKTKRSSRHS